MYICAGEIEQFSFAKAVGIGLVDVAINLTKLCLEQKPQEIIFVGTAGSYGDKKIFDIIQTNSATHIENSFFTNQSYTPIESSISLKSLDVSHETIVNSSDYITTDIPEDVMELLKPHINGGNDNVYERLYEFVVNGNIEFCARLVSITGDSSQIRFYNKRMMYFKDFTLDRLEVNA